MLKKNSQSTSSKDRPKERYIIQGKQVITVIEVGNGYFAEVHNIFKAKDPVIFDVKAEAMYFKTVIEVKEGKPLSNFKGSPYYKYYVERLKEEYPEYVI